MPSSKTYIVLHNIIIEYVTRQQIIISSAADCYIACYYVTCCHKLAAWPPAQSHQEASCDMVISTQVIVLMHHICDQYPCGLYPHDQYPCDQHPCSQYPCEQYPCEQSHTLAAHMGTDQMGTVSTLTDHISLSTNFLCTKPTSNTTLRDGRPNEWNLQEKQALRTTIACLPHAREGHIAKACLQPVS